MTEINRVRKNDPNMDELQEIHFKYIGTVKFKLKIGRRCSIINIYLVYTLLLPDF